jgi:HAD superfamily hydrolase (TIGR01509 family)
MATQTPRAVLFDCDGVLVDSEVIAIEVEVAALAEAGVPMTAAELADRYVGVSAASQAESLHREFGLALDDAWWQALHERSLAALADRVEAVPGMRELVEGLGVPHCLASSSDHGRIEVCLRQAGLLDLFDASIRFSATDVSRGKPAPDLFLHAASRLGVDPDACVVIEDSPHGVRAAVAAGMAVIGFTGGAHADASWAHRLHDAGAVTVVDGATALGALLP